ncbi:tagatose 1,6-diphosphate aldolase 1 [bacterium BMS3Abin02]|nr:tagatose 1,6-diphosphate aldolase 1 [bacterium BMS3Abin02]
MTATLKDTKPNARGGLPLGKRRALQVMSTPENVFAILAIDHIGALSSIAHPHDPASMTRRELVSIKVRLVDSIADLASGVLIDPVLGLEPIIGGDVLPGDTGLLVALEDGDYASLDHAPRLFEGWNVARAAKSGATAIKCSFLYDPFSPSDAVHEFVSNLVTDCERLGLPLFAEPLTPHALQADRRSAVVQAARKIGALGVDVLKLEFPIDESSDEHEWRDACLELTDASPKPWTLLSAGEDFETFGRQLEVACEAGASGYVAGRTVWKDLVVGSRSNADGATREAKRRFRHLTDIAVERATPWTAWFEGSGEAGHAQQDETRKRSE